MVRIGAGCSNKGSERGRNGRREGERTFKNPAVAPAAS